MTCCEVIPPLVNSLRAIMEHLDAQYLSPELRAIMSDALVAMANAEVRVCTMCYTNIPDGNIAGTVVYGYVPPDDDKSSA